MKRMKGVKLLVATFAAASSGCFAWGAAILPQKEVASASTKLAVTVASEADYFVYGGSVRVTDAKYGPGVKYHVAMTTAEFDKYGTIGEKMGTLDSGFATGTLLLPTSFLGGAELVRGGNYGVTLSDSDTSAVWKKTTIGGVEYMESVIYLYNIPETDYGTDFSIRGYIYDETQDSIVYTEQVDGLSMSFVAKAEYGNANTELTEDELNTLKTTYVDKTITYHIGDTTETATVEYLKTATKKVAASRQDDNDEFVGWYTKQGNEFDFSTSIKNNVHVYAHYRESIVLSSLDSTQAIKTFRADTYKRAATDTILSMTLNLGGSEYNLGNNPDAVDVSGFEANLEQHGEGTVTVTYQRANSSRYTLELPTLVVTRDITTLAEIGSSTHLVDDRNSAGIDEATVSTTFVFKAGAYATATDAADLADNAMFGYYRIAKDLGYFNSWGHYEEAYFKNNTGSFGSSVSNLGMQVSTQGFRGTLDGAGHTVVATGQEQGLFQLIGDGAVIKDLDITAVRVNFWSSHTLFATSIYEATFENISITTKYVGSSSTTVTQNVGMLSTWGARGASFKNINLHLDYGGTLKSAPSIFGGHYWGSGYESGFATTSGNLQNKYKNFVIYAAGVGAMGYGKNGTGSTAETEAVTVQAEIDAGNDITFVAGATPSNETAELTTRQTVVMNDPSTWNLNLGKYADMNVTNITLGTTSFGSFAEGLAIPETFKTALTSHGEQDLTVTITKMDGYTLTLTVPVLFVTEEIYTTERFEEIFTYPTAQAYYGYYRLGGDIGDQNWNFNANGRGSANNEWRDYGFRGTFDGNSHTITGIAAHGGLFGWIGTGAVIKNVNICDYGTVSGSYRSILASTIAKATLEDIRVTVCTTTGIIAPTTNQQVNGLLALQWCFGTTLTDVTVDAGLNQIYALFGACSYGGYEHTSTDKTPVEMPNTYENVVVNAGALSYIGYWYDSTSVTFGTFHGITEEAGVTINILESEIEDKLTIENEIVLSGSTAEFAIDLGEYEGATIESITYAGHDLGVEPAALVTADVLADDTLHGEKKDIIVTLFKANGQKVTLTVPTDIITKDIATLDDLKAITTYTENKAYHGYYRQTANLGAGGSGHAFGALVKTTTDGITTYTNRPGMNANIEWDNTFTRGFAGTYNGNNYTIKGYSSTGGIFGWIGKGAVLKNMNIVDVYNKGAGYTSILAQNMYYATLEDVTVTMDPYWTGDTQPGKPTDANFTTQGFNKGWLTYGCTMGTTFRNVTLNLNGYQLYSIFGASYYKGYEHYNTDAAYQADGRVMTKVDNVYELMYVNGTIGRLGYYVETSGDKTTSTMSYNYVDVSVDDENATGGCIVYNGEAVDREVTLTENVGQIVMQGTKTRSDVAVEEYASYSLMGASLELEDGNTYTLAEDEVSLSDLHTLIPSEVVANVSCHGEQKLKLIYEKGIMRYIVTAPVTLVTLEITTAAELATFLRDYASVAKDEKFMGFTAAGQTASDKDRTFRWEGTNVYDGYFTLGADINYASHKNEDKSLNIYASAGQIANPYDNTSLDPVAGGYWYPMGIDFLPGNEEKGFRGVFDGQGHTITGISVYNYKAGVGASTSGLISKLTADGVIRNVGFVNAKAYLGALVSSWGHGTIENIYVKYHAGTPTSSTWDAKNYVVGVDAASSLNAVGEQLAYIKDSIIDVSALSSMDKYGTYLGFTRNEYTNIENVIFYGAIADGAGIAYYPGNASGLQGFYNMPLGSDSFTHYTNVGELVRNHKAAINGWDSAFEAKSDGVYFNGTKILSGTEAAAPATNYLVNQAKTGSDYVLVYDETNATVSNMATYLIDQVRRASGTVDYYESTNSSTGAVITQGIFEELVTGGVILKKLSNVAWDENARYIVLGDWDLANSAGVSIPEGYDYTIQWEGNSLFILASSDDGYNPAVNRFLEEAIGFRGLSDSYSSYDDVAGRELIELMPWTMNGDITFHSRSQTGFNNSAKREIKAINGYGFFNSSGPVQEDGTIRSTHNAMYWLPNNTTMYPVSKTGESTLPAGYATNSKWYSTYTRNNGTYTGYDLCYTARGTKGSSDSVYTATDSNAYDQMVYWTAQHMLSVLNKLDPNKDAEKEILTFGCMDDVTVYYACTCSGCSSYTGGAATTLIVDFLNRVLGLVLAERTDVVLYMLGYYYLEDPEGVTVSYPDNFGVIYAPISRPTTAQGGTEAVETKSIYDATNDEVRARIADWAGKVNHMAFWFYDTLYGNFMMPMDTYRSMLTWMEYAARTCKTADVNVGWFTVNGQSSVYNPTGFADFKTYLVQKAEIEILEKITVDGSNANYNTQIDAYLAELENEFFGRNTDGSFNDKGYYGPAAANQAMYNFYKQMCTDYQNKVKAGTSTGRVVDDILTQVTCSYTVNYTYTYTSISQWSEKTKTGSATGTSTITFDKWVSNVVSALTSDATTVGKNSISQKDELGYSLKSFNITSITINSTAMTNWSTAEVNYYLQQCETAWLAVGACSLADKDIFYRHILQETIFPRFVVCMGSTGYSHGGSILTSTDQTTVRKEFQANFAELGNDRYSEHGYMSAVYSAWGI